MIFVSVHVHTCMYKCLAVDKQYHLLLNKFWTEHFNMAASLSYRSLSRRILYVVCTSTIPEVRCSLSSFHLWFSELYIFFRACKQRYIGQGLRDKRDDTRWEKQFSKSPWITPKADQPHKR